MNEKSRELLYKVWMPLLVTIGLLGYYLYWGVNHVEGTTDTNILKARSAEAFMMEDSRADSGGVDPVTAQPTKSFSDGISGPDDILHQDEIFGHSVWCATMNTKIYGNVEYFNKTKPEVKSVNQVLDEAEKLWGNRPDTIALNYPGTNQPPLVIHLRTDAVPPIANTVDICVSK